MGGPREGISRIRSVELPGSFTSWSHCIPVPAGAEGKSSTYLQALDLCPLKLQPSLQLTDLGLLPAHQRLVHHGLLQELQLALQALQLRWGGIVSASTTTSPAPRHTTLEQSCQPRCARPNGDLPMGLLCNPPGCKGPPHRVGSGCLGAPQSPWLHSGCTPAPNVSAPHLLLQLLLLLADLLQLCLEVIHLRQVPGRLWDTPGLSAGTPLCRL